MDADDYGKIAHDAYEIAAKQSGWETQEVSRVPWGDVPAENQAATTAAAMSVVAAERERILAELSDTRMMYGYSLGAWMTWSLCHRNGVQHGLDDAADIVSDVDRTERMVRRRRWPVLAVWAVIFMLGVLLGMVVFL